ncbi:alpha/beta hydrolase [Phytohabitans suffuscus]|uniref:Alpha/beta hydrolase n=1 Tax=Phytohabitans suffuscus TaxID=624315 RepID=A0A6F8YW88_9ACTN|nr:alpha/beta hydrolase [Phytohabitans suffuscus]BCB90198.1 alpha/beta hydrolase [Phytohabitans suffuscus]
MSDTTAGRYADVNGINLYYETHGAGRPMILLHGGLGSGEMFAPILPALTERHQVILVDLQGHGRTADIDRPLDIALMADDVAALIGHLGLDRPDVVGYSLGGGVALRIALKYPEKVGRLVSASRAREHRRDPRRDARAAGPGERGGGGVHEGHADVRVVREGRAAPGGLPRLLDKIGEAMSHEFDLSDEVRGLLVPTLIVAADADMAPPSHFVEVFKLLDGGLRDGGWIGEGRPKGGHALAILPGLTHYNLFMSPLFVAVTLAFLDQAENA